MAPIAQTVKGILSTQPAAVAPETTGSHAACIMRERNVGALVVSEGGWGGPTDC